MAYSAATRLNSWRDNLISVVSIVAYATPLFWVGLMLILVFSIKLGWFPTSGMEDVVAFNEGWARVVDIAHHLVLPAITLSLFYMALYTRLMRAAMLEQRGMDYVITARAKGLTERQITRRHVLRNAVLPVVTMAGVQVGSLLGGSVVVEIGLCVAGPRFARFSVTVRAGLQSAARHLLSLGLPRRSRQSCRRSRLLRPRPAHRHEVIIGHDPRFLAPFRAQSPGHSGPRLSAALSWSSRSPHHCCSPQTRFGLWPSRFCRRSASICFGTDMLGRDIAAGLVYGARTSLMVGIVATVVAVAGRRSARRDSPAITAAGSMTR